MWTYNYNNELMHYGVKGMKWGVRKKLNSIINFGKNRRIAKNTKIRDTAIAGIDKAIQKEKKKADSLHGEVEKMKKDRSFATKKVQGLFGVYDDRESKERFGLSMDDFVDSYISDAKDLANDHKKAVKEYITQKEALLSLDMSTIKTKEMTRIGKENLKKVFY